MMDTVPSPASVQGRGHNHGVVSDTKQYDAIRFYDVLAGGPGPNDVNFILSREVSGLLRSDRSSERRLKEMSKPWYVELSYDTSMGFAEAVEFFKRLEVPSSATISQLEWRGKLGFYTHRIKAKVPFIDKPDFPFGDLDPNLIQRISDRAHCIDLELIRGRKNSGPGFGESIPPVIRYETYGYFDTVYGHIQRRMITYKNIADAVEEPTLKQILGAAKTKINPEDIARLNSLIREKVEL